MRLFVVAAVAGLFLMASPAFAGELTTKVYGATLDAGTTEIETRIGRMTGGEASGETGLLFEAAHHFSDRFYAGVETEFERAPHGKLELEAVALESIVTLGRIKPLGIDVAVLGEVEAVRHAPNVIATKLLLEKRAGEFDARLNLIAEKAMRSGEPVSLGYAASADVEVAEELRLGAVALGELGSFRNFTVRGGHFAGPVVKYEFEKVAGGEFGIETGYLFALGQARHETDGQIRLLLEFERHF